jgi:MYXO-CTERM domain-containing protein
MKTFLAACTTAVLFTTLGLAQGTSNSQSPKDNQTQYYDDAPRHDYGWMGLLGLLGLGGLVRRHNTADRDTGRDIDRQRAA